MIVFQKIFFSHMFITFVFASVFDEIRSKTRTRRKMVDFGVYFKKEVKPKQKEINNEKLCFVSGSFNTFPSSINQTV